MTGWVVVLGIVAGFAVGFLTDGYTLIAAGLVCILIGIANDLGARDGYKRGYRQGTIDLALKATERRGKP